MRLLRQSDRPPAATAGAKETILARLRPAVAERLPPAERADLAPHHLTARVKEIVLEGLAREKLDLNLLEIRTLVGRLVDELAADATAAAVPAGPPDRACPPAPFTPRPVPDAEPMADRPLDEVPSILLDQAAPLRAEEKATVSETVEEAKTRIQPVLIERIDMAAASRLSRPELAKQIGRIVADILAEADIRLNAAEQRDLVTLLVDDMRGLGPLEPLLADETITDIMVNGPHQIYVEQGGKLRVSSAHFRDDAHVLNIAQRIVTQVGRRIDDSTPYVDARLADGSRVNIVIPPLAIDGPSISIRKFSEKKITLDVMQAQQNLSPAMATVLKIAARSRLNILISGGTGSGKTTLLNALSRLIDSGERIVTIEDAAELQLQQPHVVRLETRPENIEGGGLITQRDLLKNTLRMRPDRIILGEVRGEEAVDMLQAMNTGHEGSMCTVHANSAREALTRLENMVGLAGVNLSPRAVRTQIADAIDMIVQVSRMRDGIRRIVSVTEVVGMEGEVITTQELFRFDFEGEDADGRIAGSFESSGLRPAFAPKASYFGLERALLEAM